MPMCTTGAGPAAALLGSSGPTVLLDANWATDTIVDDGLVPIADGNPVDVWTMATGGDFNYTTAAVAGASARPIWVAASGVHTNGASAALTTATPVTIPADTDVDVWVYLQYTSGSLIVFGKTDSVAQMQIAATGSYVSNAGDVSISDDGTLTAGVRLFRYGRTSGAWSLAYTGRADTAMTDDGLGNLAIAYDTLLGCSGSGAGLDQFSGTGNYIRALRIATYPDGYSGRAAYRSAYEIATAGAALT